MAMYTIIEHADSRSQRFTDASLCQLPVGLKHNTWQSEIQPNHYNLHNLIK